MSSGQKPRTLHYFPRMKVRSTRQRSIVNLEALIPIIERTAVAIKILGAVTTGPESIMSRYAAELRKCRH